MPINSLVVLTENQSKSRYTTNLIWNAK